MASIFLNGVLASTELNATVVGGTTPDAIAATGALESGLVKGAQNLDTITYDLIGQNITSESVINGNQANDVLQFSNTFSALDSTIRNSTIYGGDGNDSISVTTDVNLGLGSYLRGNEGDDSIDFIQANGTWINGNQGADILTVGAAGLVAVSIVNSSINGGIGDDSINANAGAGAIDGGWIRGDDGDDSIALAGAINDVLVNGNADDDSIFLSAAADLTGTTIRGGDGDDSIILTGATTGSTVFGDEGDDTISGSSNDETIDGGDGDDSITTAGGSDVLTGGAGSDLFQITADFDSGVDIVDFETVTDDVTAALTATVAVASSAGSTTVALGLSGAFGLGTGFSVSGAIAGLGAQATTLKAGTLANATNANALFSGANLTAALAAGIRGTTYTAAAAGNVFRALFLDVAGADAGLYIIEGTAAGAGLLVGANAIVTNTISLVTTNGTTVASDITLV